MQVTLDNEAAYAESFLCGFSLDTHLFLFVKEDHIPLLFPALGHYRTRTAWPRHYSTGSRQTGDEGEDLSLIEFNAIQYRRKGNAVVDDGQLARNDKVPKREFMRRGINQHTLEKICRKEAVRASERAEMLKVLQQWESE
jgi:hypothetical protein